MTGPMLAAKVDVRDLASLRFPIMASNKLDGIRATVWPEGPRTRSMKLIPNRHVRSLLETLPVGVDGEICLLNPDGSVNFRDTDSAVMSFDGEPDVVFYIFDYVKYPNISFVDRLMHMRAEVRLPPWAKILSQVCISSPEQAEAMFEKALAEKCEGLVFRDPEGRYKSGRSTFREGGMIKVKPWEDTEGVVEDVYEEFHNANEATTNELGRTKRSSHQVNKIGKGTMGGMLVRSPLWESELVRVGIGFSAAERAEYWTSPPIGRTITFKYLAHGGYDAPRHAVFKGFRNEDLSPPLL